MSTHTTEYVILVDEHDQIIGREEKMKAHELGLLHRAFSVFIYRKINGVTEFLLQQRHQDKYHCGALWTNACCSHPRWDETIVSAGQRRLKEELSLEAPLTEVGVFKYKASFENGLIEHEWDHVLIGEYNALQPVRIHSLEVQNFEWVSVKDLLNALSLEPQRYTPWLKPALTIVLENLCCQS